MKIFVATLCFVLAPVLVLAEEVAIPENGTSVSEAIVPPEESASSPTLQLKGGPGFATMSGISSEATEIKSSTGLHFAAEVDFPLNPSFSFLTGLNYIQKGFRQLSTSGIDGAGSFFWDIQGKITYLELPAMIKLNFGERTRFSILAGPYFAYRLGMSLSGTVRFSDQTQTVDQDVEDDAVSRTDYGIRAGLSVEWPLNPSLGFVVGAAYDFGLKNIAASNGEPTDSTAKNRVLLANAGLAIHL